MDEASKPWSERSWQHWFRPWTVLHGSWSSLGHERLIAQGADEFWLRGHYPDWCELYALAPTPQAMPAAPWWRLFSLPPQAFDRTALLVGWTLRFAEVPASRLMRGGASLPPADLRWALGRALLIPAAWPERLHWHVGPVAPPADWHAAASLCHCVRAEAASLWSRLRLRCPRDWVESVEGQMSSAAAVEGPPLMARLWHAAARHAFAEPDRAAPHASEEPSSCHST
jgi:hypothetical protein